MILYFADRQMNIIGQSSTHLPDGLTVYADLKTEDVESGVSSFECRIPYDKTTRSNVEKVTAVGNYILRSNGNENEFYTIIESESDTRDKEVYVYAEDAGLDLLNEIVSDYSTDEAHNIDFYVNKFTSDSGFEIGINEVPNLKRKLSWEGESTVATRLASVASGFGGCEISFSFEIEAMTVKKKFINIYKKRGQDTGVQLRLNSDIDRIITKKSIGNLATALKCKGGIPNEKNAKPVTLKGYKYDDGDFYVDGDMLKSRSAVKQWSRYIWNNEPNKLAKGQGHITRPFNYDTLSQETLCAKAISELKKVREIEVNYEVDISEFPEDIRIGDYVTIVDDEIELYVFARILMLETSVTDESKKATIGDYVIKKSGISQSVQDMSFEFAKLVASAQVAMEIAETAQETAETAQTTADDTKKVIEDASEEMDGIVEQTESAILTSEKIFMEALNSYTSNGDFSKYKEKIESQLDTMAKQMDSNLTTALKQIMDVDDNLQEKFNTITKYFMFDINGLTIGKIDSPFKVIIDNDIYRMTVNGVNALLLDPDGISTIPELNVTKKFMIFGLLIDESTNENDEEVINCEYVGG